MFLKGKNRKRNYAYRYIIRFQTSSGGYTEKQGVYSTSRKMSTYRHTEIASTYLINDLNENDHNIDPLKQIIEFTPLF